MTGRRASWSSRPRGIKSVDDPPPIPDDVLADYALDLFLKGYEPLLYAANLGLTPEQVWDQIRYTLQECFNKLSREGKAGRPQKDNAKPASLAQRERRRLARLKGANRNG